MLQAAATVSAYCSSKSDGGTKRQFTRDFDRVGRNQSSPDGYREPLPETFLALPALARLSRPG